MSDNRVVGVQSKPPYGRYVLIDWEYVSMFTNEPTRLIIDILMCDGFCLAVGWKFFILMHDEFCLADG